MRKFLCWQPDNETEDEAEEVEAEYAEDAIEEYFEKYVDEEAADELLIRAKYPETGMEWDFRVKVYMEPVYRFEEVY